MENYLILGGNGFLGSQLNQQLVNNQVHTYFYNRVDNTVVNTRNGFVITFDEYLSANISYRVINLLAAWGAGIDDKSLEYANFDLPLNIFNKIASTGKKILWIQISSYYFFYFLKFGIDKDQYSFFKRMLSDKLKENSEIADGKVIVLDVYLPHLYGDNDKNDRLIKMLTSQKNLERTVNLSSGSQILPILNLQDCARGLCKLILKFEPQLKYTQIYIREQSQLTIKQIVQAIQRFHQIKVQYNVLPERENEFYIPITTPINNFLIDKLTTFEQYLSTIYNKEIHG
jgi:nucleoside-diphosphate-sugar epimerase